MRKDVCMCNSCHGEMIMGVLAFESQTIRLQHVASLSNRNNNNKNRRGKFSTSKSAHRKFYTSVLEVAHSTPFSLLCNLVL